MSGGWRAARWLAVVVVLAVSPAACSGARAEGLDASKLPEPVRGDYEVFARKCSKCHSLARPLGAGITDDEQWTMYVARMRRQPGSGIFADDEVAIVRFLRFHAAELRKKKGGAPATEADAGVRP
jgi:hypothetical protein